MKKAIAMLLALMLLSTGLVGLAEADKQTISVFFGGGTPLSIDPALNSAVNGSNILKLSHVGLMGWQYVDGSPAIAPELAESYTVSEDGMTYSFTLREGLKWSDGSDFKASDISKSWERAASLDLGADYGYLFEVIEGFNGGEGPLNVTVDDEARTLTVKLVSAAPYFLELCAFPPFMPVKVDAADNEGIWATKPETYVGTGAFRMTKYAVDDVISFEKNEHYWDAENVKLGEVNCYLSEDNVAILTAYENGTASFINAIDPTEYPRLQSTYPGELVFGPYLGTWYILLNVHKDISPASKQLTVQEMSRARFAIGQLINRQELVEYVTQGGQAPATGFYPAGLGDGLNADVRTTEGYGTWYADTNTPSEENANYTVDQVAAVKTLMEIGYPYTGSIEGGDIRFTDFASIEFSFNNSGANAAIIQYVQEVWNTFGIPATINTEAWSTLQQKLKEGDGEAARMGWIADFNDTSNFIGIFISDSGNNYPRLGKDVGTYTRFTEATKDAGMGAYWGENGDQTWAEAYDSLYQKILLATDPAERAAMSAEAEKVLMATGGVNPMYFYTNPYMLKPNVQDVMIMSNGDVNLTYTSIS
jgi:oligopeptide transport system substrate-binding protein